MVKEDFLCMFPKVFKSFLSGLTFFYLISEGGSAVHTAWVDGRLKSTAGQASLCLLCASKLRLVIPEHRN